MEANTIPPPLFVNLSNPKQGSAADPTSNLSFNLSLTDDQKKARADVQLPYLKAQETEQKAVITYHPDEADDFDEEDPDDDLDI